MGLYQAKESQRLSVTVPSVSGDYASERITFGADSSGIADQSYLGVTVLIETSVPGMVVELWLPQVRDASITGSDRTDANYFYSGLCCAPAGVAFAPSGQTASFGSATWPLAGWPGAQLRVKSGGSPGVVSISATAD